MMLEQARTEGKVSPVVEKFMELLKDEAFVKDFANCASAEAMKELLEQVAGGSLMVVGLVILGICGAVGLVGLADSIDGIVEHLTGRHW